MATGGSAVLATTLLTVVSVQADSSRSVSCVGSRWSVNCVVTHRHGIVDPFVRDLEPLSEAEIAANREREEKWRERCNPVAERDRYGVARYVYAKPGCEFGATVQ
jgi:1-aminocyclopropane-1-carboxylate deaminase/D-cysteine desulfhydrase-like pyridoxal-dependent ACC family enzyme